MAKARRKRSTSSAPPAPAKGHLERLGTPPDLRKLALPREQREALRKLALPHEQAEALRKALAQERAMLWPQRPPTAAPANTDKPLGRKAQRAAEAVLELRRDGYNWPSREALRRRVTKMVGENVSPGTIKQVLTHLRKFGQISR